ncbi:MAG: efflux RND transporter periplasmic adaptor subunit, partial [Candidatus Staskawiczbacteria bacterium]|nr:efflux RND transporter periplasmic adaptor subunit [Candidatus Staskawiczbacteria bacterium]
MKIHIPKFFRKKRNIWIITILAIVVFLGFLIFARKNNIAGIQTASVQRQNLQETVLSTGQVVSGIDLALSFQSGGVVRRVLANEGDQVKQGQLLASLDQSSALASLTSARGALLQAQANYDKLIAGATFEDVNTGITVIESRKIALDGAYNSALNTLDDARLKSYNVLSAVTALQNTYFTGFDQNARDGKTQIQNALVSLELSLDRAKSSGLQSDIDSAVSTAINSLNTISNALKVIRDTLDETYYYGIIPNSEKTAVDVQRANINTALTNVTNDQQAISNAKISLLQSRPEIDFAKGQILSAQGQVDSAQAVLNNTVILSPASGTITAVDIKVGEQATPLKEVLVLQDPNNLHAEADVSEANIASLQVGQSIDYTFDALGPDQHFTGKVLSVNPASTVISGVVNYLVKGGLDNVPDIKPGMTANMTIMVAQKNDVLAVPSTAVINKNNKQYVRVIDDSKKKTYHQIEVQTGLQADGGLIEIISGLS